MEAVALALTALRPRGPDGSGFEVGEDWVLGHTRLAILDLTDLGAQPMRSKRGSWIVFNGEIYNFHELRDELAAEGVRIRSTGDTEVLLAALERWGTDALLKLRGMFAFGWLHPENKELILARDRYGVKPLVWERTADGVRFASDLFALDAMAGGASQREIDPEQAREFLLHGCVPAPGTIWKGPRKLVPGNFLRVRWYDNAPPVIEESSYWTLRDVPQASTRSEVDAFDTLSKLLREAVELRLISDVPVGLLLSGGIDSSLIGAVCAEVPGAQVPTFTMGFDDPVADERPYARSVADLLQLPHEDFVADPADVVSVFGELWDSYDEPFADTSALPTVVLCREIRKRVKVVMGGDGGDEVWCGYPWHRALGKLDRLAWMPRLVRRFASAVVSLFGGKWRYFARVAAAPDRLSAWSVLRTGLSDELARFLPVDAASRPISESYRAAAERVGSVADSLDWACRMDLTSYLPDVLMVKGDRASMRVGLELREPLLDHQFTAAGLELASSYRFERKRQRGKTFARTYLARRLPPSLIDRGKRGFTPPLSVWLEGPLRKITERAIAALESGALYPLKLPVGVSSWTECAKILNDTNQQYLWRVICFWGWKNARCAASSPE
jgi:asparagine synthase (glutamine-hydrolysing)